MAAAERPSEENISQGSSQEAHGNAGRVADIHSSGVSSGETSEVLWLSDVCGEQIRLGFQKPKLDFASCVSLSPTSTSRKCTSDYQHRPWQELSRSNSDNTTMIASWKISYGLMSICLLQCRVVSQKVQLEPLNSTALRDSDVQFKATIQGDWEVTNWGVGGIQVLTIINSTNTIIPLADRFSARFCVNTGRSCVEFTIHNVTRADAGQVVCNVQGHQAVIAQLFVQESGTVSIPGGNVTVKQGGEVELECVTTAWFPVPTISWTQNGQAVNSSLYNTTSTPDGDSFNSTSTVRLTASRNARVECLASLSALTAPQSSSVYIEIVPKPPDWTVLIAVVVSFGSCGLLVFLILGIVIFYKHRKEKKRNYQDEMRRVGALSQLSVISTGEQVKGQVNEYYEPENQKNDTNDWTESGFMKHRHMTFV